MVVTASFSRGAGAASIKGGHSSVANVRGIQASGLGGRDTIILDETDGAHPSAQLFANIGYDVLSGSSGNDQLFARYCGGHDG